MIRASLPGLSLEERRFFRDELRNARARALKDAESFHDVIASVERLGALISPVARGLGELRPKLLAIAAQSPAAARTKKERALGLQLDDLFELVRIGRNDAVHHGAYARHLAKRCIELALYLEDGLMIEARCVADFMVRDPATAVAWQPVAVARQRMLAESFSNLPILIDDEWYFLTDHAIALYLSSHSDRAVALRRRIGAAVKDGGLFVSRAVVVKPQTAVDEAMSKSGGAAVLVVENGTLVGIATPFDFL